MSALIRCPEAAFVLWALSAGCSASSPSTSLTYATLPRPLFLVDVEDGVCSSMVLLDGSGQLWTSKTCDGQSTDDGLVKASKASSADVAQVQALFASLPPTAQLNCPDDDTDANVAAPGGSSSGTAIPLSDAIADSFVTLQLETAQTNESWAACQAQGAILDPFDGPVEFLRGLVGE